MKTWHVMVLASAIFLGLMFSGGIYEVSSPGGRPDFAEAVKINRFTGRTWVIMVDATKEAEVRQEEH